MQFNRLVIKLAVIFAFIFFALANLLSQHPTHTSLIAQTVPTSNPFEPTESNLALGLDHYTAHCATCHGETGKADTQQGKQLDAEDLTAQKIQSKPDAELFQIISKGVPGTPMPAFGKTHQPAEIWHIILFLRKLPALTPEERQKLERALPAGARHRHDASTSPQEQKQPSQVQSEHMHNEHDGHEKTDGPGAHEMKATMTTLTGGPFRSMHAIGSGTSLLPANSPGYMWHWVKGDWIIMLHGDLKVSFNHQGGPRGVNKAESQNYLMLMAERPVERGRLMLRGMFSAEPLTVPGRGFPQLFQTGETFQNRPLIDAQHPHDLFMEMAVAYTVPLAERVSLHLYGGPVAEPALGPVAFMHRPSASENPAAPLGHHWQDSTHIAHGVFTLGMTAGQFRVESSVFRGAEPDQNRATIDLGKLDSYSGRLWFAPTANWTMQISYGYLTNPEALEPGDLRRLTASVHHNRSWREGHWASSLIWGRNDEEHGDSNAYLLESTVNFRDKNYLYTRLELADRLGLLQENIFGRRGLIPARVIGDMRHDDEIGEFGELAGRAFRVGAFTFGGVRDIVSLDRLRIGIGADVTFYYVPDGLKPLYGSNPTSFHVFARIRPGKMNH